MKAYHIFSYGPESTGNSRYSLSEESARKQFDEVKQELIDRAIHMAKWCRTDTKNVIIVANDFYEKEGRGKGLTKEEYAQQCIEDHAEPYDFAGKFFSETITFDNCKDYGWRDIGHSDMIAWEIIEIKK